MAYATVDDLRLRWPDMPPGSESTVQARLEDVSMLLDQLLLEGHTVSAEVLRYVVCQVVKRALSTSDVPDGATSLMQTAGPYSEQVHWSNPSGDLFLTRFERKLLGLGTIRAGTVDMLAGRPTDYGVEHDSWGDSYRHPPGRDWA